eukprot:TRINITY_DN4867_c0_g1_i1.p1 TRINITY_DN4867_c0_g1~~TRINITY_DN4867_c0_g1_i1.p1  ORF type:complete len:108 (+),score=21.70 TRINITY_DN4867_c0_g1_i1:402-725(+)
MKVLQSKNRLPKFSSILLQFVKISLVVGIIELLSSVINLIGGISKFDIVHSNVVGPIPPASLNDAADFITFIDDRSHECLLYTMKGKDETFETFKAFKAGVENETMK